MNLSDIHIILGSASPRRKQLLESLGLKIEIRIRHTDETFPPEISGSDVAVFLAKRKSEAFDGMLNHDDILITADTIVCMEKKILNKPADKNEAFEMLRSLSGKTHKVYTGVCINFRSEKKCFFEESLVTFNELPDQAILDYIDEYSPFDKAGSYGAQECLPEGMDPCSQIEKDFLQKSGQADYFKNTIHKNGKKHFPFIKNISGSYFNVMGLPVVKVWEHLHQLTHD